MLGFVSLLRVHVPQPNLPYNYFLGLTEHNCYVIDSPTLKSGKFMIVIYTDDILRDKLSHGGRDQRSQQSPSLDH